MTLHVELHRAETEAAVQDPKWIEKTLTHDFNNMLSVALSQTSLALRKLSPDNPAFLNVEKSLRALQRASELSHYLSNEQQYEQCGTEEFSLNRIVLENVDLVEPSLDQEIEIELDLCPELFPIAGNVCQLQQILTNLLLNAMEAITKPAGHIRLKTSNRILSTHELQGYMSSVSLTTGVYVVLDVSDDGAGIDPSDISQIFKVHFSTKAQGRGVGLTSVLQNVNKHGGGLTIYSTCGKGTTVEVVLPALLIS